MGNLAAETFYGLSLLDIMSFFNQSILFIFFTFIIIFLGSAANMFPICLSLPLSVCVLHKMRNVLLLAAPLTDHLLFLAHSRDYKGLCWCYLAQRRLWAFSGTRPRFSSSDIQSGAAWARQRRSNNPTSSRPRGLSIDPLSIDALKEKEKASGRWFGLCMCTLAHLHLYNTQPSAHGCLSARDPIKGHLHAFRCSLLSAIGGCLSKPEHSLLSSQPLRCFHP